MEQALSGIRILEFGQYIPGPYAAMLMAEQGAEVIKVERPGGDPYRSEPGFMVFNRSKKGIVLDLKQTRDRVAAYELAAQSDVIIENFAPGVADRLGIGFDETRRINPRAVYLSISGYGPKGPYRDRPGWDATVSATTGLYAGQVGGVQFQPVYLVLPLASYYTALMGVYSTTTALYHRELTGKGQKVEISLFGSILNAASAGLTIFEGRIRIPPPYNPRGNSPLYRLYQGSDGGWFFLGLGNLTFFAKFAIAMELDEWLIDERFEGAPFLIMPPENEKIAAELERIFATRTRDEWLAFLQSEDIPCAPADPITTYISDPQIKANKMAVRVEDAERGSGLQMGVPVNLEGAQGKIRSRSPKLGEHTHEILAELGSRSRRGTDRREPQQAAEETADVPEESSAHPLEGLTVLDLTTMINGPYCAKLLSEMGAEVIKIEPPDGDPWRIMGAGFVGVNRGKRSVVIDLKEEEGRKIVYEIVARTDVIVENARWGVWHRLGLDYESVRKTNPDIIYLSISGYGPTGPYSGLPGYDPLMQARSGQMVTQGGLGKAPVFHILPVNDMAAPMLGAFGVALALLSRKRTGKGQSVWTSLVNAGAVMQAHQFLDYEGVDYKDLGDSGLLGLNATHRLYEAKDGRWLLISCAMEDHWRGLCEAIGLENLLTDTRFDTPESRAANDDPLAEILSKRFLERPWKEWLSLLSEANTPVALVQGLLDMLTDPHCLENGVFDEREHPELGMVKQVGLIPRFSGMSGVIRRPAPVYGQHTEEVLSELGYSDRAIAELLANGVAFDTPESE